MNRASRTPVLRAAIFIVAAVAGIVLAAALAGPLASALASSPVPWVARLARGGAPRLFGRLALLFVGGVVVAAAVVLGVRRPAQLGWRDPPRLAAEAGLGLLIGAAMFVVIGGLAVLGRAREFVPPGWGAVFPEMPRYLRAGIGAAVVEETLFRGLLLLACVRAGRTWLGAVGGSALFSTAHWLRLEPGDAAVSARDLLAEVGAGLARIPGEWIAWLALFLAAMLLCVTVLRSGRLGWAIGLHTAWVVGLKSLIFLTNTLPVAGWRRVWLGADGAVEGLAAGILMAVVAALFMAAPPAEDAPWPSPKRSSN